MNQLFEITPEVTENDIKRLMETGILNKWKTCPAMLAKYDPTKADLKKLILLELGRSSPRWNILKKLAVRFSQKERDILLIKLKHELEKRKT